MYLWKSASTKSKPRPKYPSVKLKMAVQVSSLSPKSHELESSPVHKRSPNCLDH